jgi:hypothetical protein
MRSVHLWLTVSAAFSTACGQPTGPADSGAAGARQVGTPPASVVVKTPIEDNFTEFVDCAGEVLEFHLREQLVVHESQDARGGIHFHFVINDKGSTAEGLSSGTRWHQVGATKENDNIRGEAPMTISFVNAFNLISNGPAPNLLIHEQFHITLNANGVVTALVERSRIECK